MLGDLSRPHCLTTETDFGAEYARRAGNEYNSAPPAHRSNMSNVFNLTTRDPIPEVDLTPVPETEPEPSPEFDTTPPKEEIQPATPPEINPNPGPEIDPIPTVKPQIDPAL